MIYEKFLIAATNTDVLSAGRLNAIPYNGVLVLDFLSDLGNAANHFDLTIQKPNGDVPVDAQPVNASSAGVDMLLDDRELERFTFQAGQGGHFTVSLTMTGTAVCAVRAVLR